MDELTRQKRQREFTIYLVLFILLVIVGKITLNGQQVGSGNYNGNASNSPYGSGIYTGAYYNDPFYGGMPQYAQYGGYDYSYNGHMGYGYGPPQMAYGMGQQMGQPQLDYRMYNAYYPNQYGHTDPYQMHAFGGHPYGYSYGGTPQAAHYGYGSHDPFLGGNPGWNGGYPQQNPGWNGGYHYGGPPEYGWSGYPQTAYPHWGGPVQSVSQQQGYGLGWNGYYGGPPELGRSPHLEENGWNYGYEVPMNQMGPNWW